MENNYIFITSEQLLFASVLMAVNIGLSIIIRLGMAKQWIMASLRMTVQLLLDEPTASMDTELTRLMEDLLEKWHKCSTEIFPAPAGQQAKRAWIWVSHNLGQLTRMCGQTYSLDADDGK